MTAEVNYLGNCYVQCISSPTMSIIAVEEQVEHATMLRPKDEANLKKLSYEMFVDLTAGSVGGVACVYVGQPFDTVKVRMQVSSHLYKSSSDCMRAMVTKEGFKGFYAGTAPALVANVGENAVLFLCYGQCQKVVQLLSGRSADNLNAFHQALSGSLASFFSSFVLCPLELVKCRLQTAQELGPTKKKISPMSIVRETLRQDGIAGFYRGFVGTLAREMPGYFFFFGGYEGTKYLLTPQYKTGDSLSLWKTAVAGGVGGVSLWATVYPADVVKSRSQVQRGANVGFFRLLTTIVKKEGPRALYRGIGPCLLRAGPACAALFVAFEWTKKALS